MNRIAVAFLAVYHDKNNCLPFGHGASDLCDSFIFRVHETFFCNRLHTVTCSSWKGELERLVDKAEKISLHNARALVEYRRRRADRIEGTGMGRRRRSGKENEAAILAYVPWLLATRAFVRERAKSRSEYCRAPEIITSGPFEVDHIIPQASAGGDEPENFLSAANLVISEEQSHFRCRSGKCREETLLFSPRQDAWVAHFDFDAGRFRLLGRTPPGRATIYQSAKL